MAGWQLITGITGLLGQYLLFEALRRREPVAVLVRGRGGVGASERVDQMLSRWENRFGKLLQRPVILMGDLREQRLGLSNEHAAWFRKNVTSVLHSAASVRFAATKSGEPTKSNFEGTKSLLDLCHGSSVRDFHYVSTAYSCGQVKNPNVVMEELHSASGPFGNVYEESKCRAEHLVIEAAGGFTRTIYRPSVIVGESVTGYSPSFNAIYTPLRLAWTLLRESPSLIRSADDLLNPLGLSGDELRNIVPVDWVSEAIGSLVRRPECHGKIYHITNPRLTTGDEIVTAMVRSLAEMKEQESVSKSGEGVSERGSDTIAGVNLADFRRHMHSYRSYFVSDPVFDNSRFRSVTACPPCPPMATDQLTRVFSFAVRNRFTASDRLESNNSESEPRQSLELIATQRKGAFETPTGDISADGSELNSSDRTPTDITIRSKDDTASPMSITLTLSGPGGGCWTISTISSGIQCRLPDFHAAQEKEIYGSAKTFRTWLNGEFSLEDAMRAGAFVVIGGSEEPEFVRQLMFDLRSSILATNDRKSEGFKTPRRVTPQEFSVVGSESC